MTTEDIKASSAVGVSTSTSVEPQEPVAPKPPEGVPAKFWDPETGKVRMEDFYKSYAELEKKLGQPKETPKETPKEPPKEEPKEPKESEGEPKEPQEPETPEYVTLRDTANDEYQKTGEVSPETKEALAKSLKVSVGDVDAWIAGQKVNFESALKDIGGSAGLETLKAWMVKNVPAAELASYNKVMLDASSTMEAKQFALKAMHAQMREATGFEGNTYGGGSASGPDVYESQAALTAAMADPRYTRDKAYTSRVQAKALRTIKSKK